VPSATCSVAPTKTVTWSRSRNWRAGSKLPSEEPLAEELIYREISNGATSDLELASRIARSMVKEYGMSRLGRVNYQERNGAAFLPGAPGLEPERGYSEHTAREIDIEVQQDHRRLDELVRGILLERRAALEVIALRLMEKEVMDGAELRSILEQTLPGPRVVPAPTPSPACCRVRPRRDQLAMWQSRDED